MTRREQQRAQLVDSLLEALYQGDSAKAQELVSKGLDRLDLAAVTHAESSESRNAVLSRGVPRWQIVSFAAAILILVVVLLPWLNTPRDATAAVSRSIRQAVRDVGRHYAITTKLRSIGGSDLERRMDLYVKGGDQCAIRTQGPLGIAPVWLGSQQGKGWVVPPLGPVITGDSSSLVTWIAQQEDVSTPYLYISTILERMRDSYQLQPLPDETLDTPRGKVKCQHIVGTLQGSQSPQTPDRIELWADARTGVAIKVVAQWELEPGAAGRHEFTIDYVEQLDLSDDFFGPDQHGGRDRPRIDCGSAAAQD